MKVRIDKNSIRYRLRKSDIEKLQHKNAVKRSISFPGAALTFELRITNTQEPTATFSGNSVMVGIPAGIASTWMTTDEVGIYHTVQFGDEKLKMSIEKDFPSKDRTDEDKSDTFAELAGKNTNNAC
ncbi:MAG TPA: hypothetical protein PKM63_13905 [Panacibacter sp.]|nr:hypothetical protein [Panacibacter sp.]HNP45379.1 hypothetical protein [Panacibacter sp.]